MKIYVTILHHICVLGNIVPEESEDDITERKTIAPAKENKLDTTVESNQCKTISNGPSTLNKSETVTPTKKHTFNIENPNSNTATTNKNLNSVVEKDLQSGSKFDYFTS